jgi:hypothetical protein
VKVQVQTLDELLATLSPIKIEWQDEQSNKVAALLQKFPAKAAYTMEDVAPLLAEDFEAGKLLIRSFLGLSKDNFEAELRGLLGSRGTGATSFRNDRAAYLQSLERLGLPEAISTVVNRPTSWSDVILERLRSGRGSAVAGQKRGKFVEDFAESIIKDVFAEYDVRCDFVGQRGEEAKCDFAIPSKHAPRIVIESKGYGATGSKMTDVIGDIEKIISAKRQDTAFLFFTDGLSWLQRKSDFRKIIEYQNQGEISRIYTLKMADTFRSDLEALKAEHGI